MKRFEDWPRRLGDFLAERQQWPFEWNKNDCCSFGIAAVEAITGVCIWPVTWTDQREALEVIKEAGGLVAAITSVLGPPSQNFAVAQRGDVGLAYIGNHQSVVICTGQTWAGPGEQQLEHLPLDAVGYVWKV